MKSTVSVAEASRHLADYVTRVADHGERFVLVQDEKPVAELRPILVGRRLGELPDLLKALPHLSTEEADEFAKDLSEARAQLSLQPLEDPWES